MDYKLKESISYLSDQLFASTKCKTILHFSNKRTNKSVHRRRNISSQKICQCLLNTRNDAQYHQSLSNCKLKPQYSNFNFILTLRTMYGRKIMTRGDWRALLTSLCGVSSAVLSADDTVRTLLRCSHFSRCETELPLDLEISLLSM